MSIVSIVKCENYNQDTVAAAVKEAINLAELDNVLSNGKSILLKPNLLSARRPEEAVTTHPAIVRALAEIAKHNGSIPIVGDSPPFAGENKEKYAKLCDLTGISDISRQLDIPIVRFEEQARTIPNLGGRYYRIFDIAEAVMSSDVLVNIPKLKTHGLTAFSGAVKNIFGCIPGIRKGLFHVQAADDREAFSQMLVDLLRAVTPGVNIMDAVVALEGEGPNAGDPKHLGLIMASSDPVALDAVACSVVGIDPLSIYTTRLAHEQGLGCGDISQIEIKGESIESVRVYDFKQSSGKNDWARIPAPVRRILQNQLVASPVISAAECAGCNDCATACPVKAIKPGKPPVIDLSKCIRCYCCNEVCNFSALKLKRGWLGSLFLGKKEKK